MGLGIVEAMAQLNTRLGCERGAELAVRLGIHTGLVVVGDVGGGTRHEQLAAARPIRIRRRVGLRQSLHLAQFCPPP